MLLLFFHKDSLAIYTRYSICESQLQRENKDERLRHHTTEKLDKNLEI